jgi:Nucleoside-diphosphate-sugar epimerases
MKILVTGAAGFIGFHVAKYLVEQGNSVIGLDNINDYYDVDLKYARLKEAGISRDLIEDHKFVISTVYSTYSFVKADLLDKDFIDELFEAERFEAVCNLAAQAGVRYSLNHPYAYINSNVIGFMNILEACRYFPVKHLVYASSSSVYGLNEKVPYSETDKVDSPISLYAVTKKTNELMAHAYSKLFRIPTTGVRFFTVYGPWGRPDMAPMLFLKAIINQTPINVYNNGNLCRDFTFIDDITKGIATIINRAPDDDIPYKIYNIGHGDPVQLLDFIGAIEKVTGKKAIENMVEMQKGDVLQTFSDTAALERDFGYKPSTSIHDGIDKLYKWYVKCF